MPAAVAFAVTTGAPAGRFAGPPGASFMLAGATAVEVGTANFWDPCASEKLVDAFERWCLEHRVEKMSELIGKLEVQ